MRRGLVKQEADGPLDAITSSNQSIFLEARRLFEVRDRTTKGAFKGGELTSKSLVLVVLRGSGRVGGIHPEEGARGNFCDV
jgi:hypothetical protein